jgi:hypothetical protein
MSPTDLDQWDKAVHDNSTEYKLRLASFDFVIFHTISYTSLDPKIFFMTILNYQQSP